MGMPVTLLHTFLNHYSNLLVFKISLLKKNLTSGNFAEKEVLNSFSMINVSFHGTQQS